VTPVTPAAARMIAVRSLWVLNACSLLPLPTAQSLPEPFMGILIYTRLIVNAHILLNI
jgi:hypothetical protein